MIVKTAAVYQKNNNKNACNEEMNAVRVITTGCIYGIARYIVKAYEVDTMLN